MPQLFTPLTIKSITLKNRIAVSPMCQYSAKDGLANQWHEVHLGSFAIGGAGLVCVEATAVSPEARITAADLGLWNDDQIIPLKTITAFIAAQGAVPGIQLAHAGRKASRAKPWEGGRSIPPDSETGWPTVGPGTDAFSPGDTPPLALDAAGIEKIKADFRSAALRALTVGFKIIEIHAAHGYLLHQFLSPLSNFRHDEYGGSFENRIRLLMEVLETVKEVWPAELPLFVRISATDWTPGGWTPENSVALAARLKTAGVDLVDCSSGGNINGATIPSSPGYQVGFAAAVRQTGILTSAVGLITGAGQADEIVRAGEADLVSLAREMLRDPHFPLRAAHELGFEASWPVQYERAKWK